MTIAGRERSFSIEGKRFQVRRTTRGVVDVRANDPQSLACGIGYAHAHDRLVQSMLIRLVGQGRLSECLKAGRGQLGADIFFRIMKFYRRANAERERLSKESRDLTEAYCLGINHCLKEESLPIDSRLARYRPQPRLLDPLWPNFVPPTAASNNWALSGWRTESGFPFECHDPHLPCNYLPPLWYELFTHVGHRFGIGVSVPGVPGLVMGRNRDVSMGFTYGYMDMMDYFIEECRDGKFLLR